MAGRRHNNINKRATRSAVEMTKICFISPEYLPLAGGTGAYVYYLSRELVKKRNSISIVTGYDENRDVRVSDQLDVHLVKVFKAPVVKSFMFAAASYKKLRGIRDIAGIDITHANLPLVPDFAVPKNFGRTLVATVHSTWEGEANAIRGERYSRLNANEKFLRSFTWFLSIFEKRMLQRAKRIIAVSDFTKRELHDYYKHKYDGKVRVVHNGVDVDKFKPPQDKIKAKLELGLKPGDIIILSVGRLYARKGLFTLVESMPAVVKSFANAKFIISGKGQSDEMQKLTSHATRLGVRDNIVFTGYTPDKKLPKLYQAADMFAFSTYYEHHPFAVLEALSSQLPVVTTNVGGIPETITNGKDGFMCQPFNSREFSDKILYLLDHPIVAQEMALRARRTILEHFDWRAVVQKVLKVYDEALN